MFAQDVLSPDPANPGNQIQTGEGRSQGVELEAEAGLPGGFSMTAGYTFQAAKITRSNAGDVGRRPFTAEASSLAAERLPVPRGLRHDESGG